MRSGVSLIGRQAGRQVRRWLAGRQAGVSLVGRQAGVSLVGRQAGIEAINDLFRMQAGHPFIKHRCHR